MTTFREAIDAFKVGDRVRLTAQGGEYPLTPFPIGAIGTVVENDLGRDIEQQLGIKMDDTNDDFEEWGNVLYVYAPVSFGDNDPETWDWDCGVEKVA